MANTAPTDVERGLRTQEDDLSLQREMSPHAPPHDVPDPRMTELELTPQTSVTLANSGITLDEKKGGNGPIYVDFAPGDSRNPYNYSYRRKWLITVMGSLYTLWASAGLTAFAIGVSYVQEEFDTSTVLGKLMLGMWPLGFALAPLVLAPFSEELGRTGMYVSTIWIMIIFFIPVAVAKNIGTVLVCRFLGGAAASTGSTMVGGTIADIWKNDERGLPMSLFTFMAFFGSGIPAVVFGFVAERPDLGWRWIQWIQLIIDGTYAIFLTVILARNETRGPVILTRVAKKMRKETGNSRYRARVEDERASIWTLIRISATRPIWLLATEPVVTVFSLWVGFAWGMFYAIIASIPYVFSSLYNFGTGSLGLVYLTICIASIFGFALNGFQERLYAKYVDTRGPEARLFGAMAAGLLFAIGAFIYGATSWYNHHWMGPCIGITIAVIGVYTIYLSVFNYLSDAYTLYASSALAGQSLCRNLLGAIFPLFIQPMYQRLGFRWAPVLVGFIALVMAVIPFVLFFYGPKIRAKSHFAKQLRAMEIEAERKEKEGKT